MGYITAQGDTWDKIAKAVYGDEYAADFLMQANRSHLETVIFDAGCELNTPARTVEQTGLLPPWRYAANG